MALIIPHFDIDVNVNDYQIDFLPVLRKIKPNWKDDEIDFKESPKSVNSGMMNTLVRCYKKGDKNGDAIMIRILNDAMDPFIDRALELACLKYLQSRDCAPTILATFKNGYCYKFIHGEILNKLRLREEPIWRQIAEELAKIHAAKVEVIPGFNKKITFLEILRFCEENYSEELLDPKRNEQFKKELPGKEILKRELEESLAHALSCKPDFVLGHNDTRAENIIWNKNTGIAKFVDYENMSYNYRAWEIAEHFIRFGGMVPLDASLFPDEEFQLAWLRVYLEKYFEAIGRQGSDVTDVAVRKLYVQVRKFYLVDLIAPGIIDPAFEAKKVLQDTEVDMIRFAIDSVKEYFKAKEDIWALQMPDEDK